MNRDYMKSNKNNSDTEVELRSRIIVENFPSRQELYQLLDQFLENSGQKKDYTAHNKDNAIHFLFKNTVLICELTILGCCLPIRETSQYRKIEE